MKMRRKIVLSVVVILFFFLCAFALNNSKQESSIFTVAKAAYIDSFFDSVTLAKGESIELYLTNTNEKITWKSNDKSIAKITPDGVLTAKKKGETTVIAKAKSFTYTCYVYVEAPKLSKKSLYMIKGDTTTLSVKGNTQPEKWSSSDKTIVKVSKYGDLTAKKAGTATITVKLGNKDNGYKVLKCKVTVETPKLSNKSLVLEPGTTKQLSVSGTKQTVKWSSSKKTVATVTENGLVQAIKYGETTITAKVGSKKYTCKVIVEKPVLSKTSLILLSENSVYLKVTGTSRYPDWTSSNPNVASVDADGEVFAKNAGTTTIQAKIGSKTLNCFVTVEEPALSATELTLTVGDTYTLKLNGTTQTVRWESSDDSVVSVSALGVITAKKAGEAIVSAFVGEEEYYCDVEVEALSLSETKITLKKGEETELYVDDTKRDIDWSSSNTVIASVNKDGKVTANEIGTAVIYAKIGNTQLQCLVTVEDPQPSIAKFTVERKTVYNGNDIKVESVESIYNDKSTGIKLYVENNSSLSLDVCVHNSAVNGIMYDNNIYAGSIDIAAGKKGYVSFYIDNNWFSSVGIQKIEYFDLLLWAYDNDESYKAFESDIIRITTNHFNHSQIVTNGKSIYNNEGLQLYLLESSNNALNFSLVNRSNTYIDFDVEDVSINDWAYDTSYDFDIYDITVFPGCKAYFTIKIDDDFLKESNISSITKAEFRLDVRIKGDYFNSYYTNPISFSI